MIPVLIIGCGNIAGGFDADRTAAALPLTHAGAYRRHGGFRLAACVDPDGERRRSFAGRWQVGRDAADVAGLGAEPGAFAVISICSPSDRHAEHVEQALALRPRLIFCEKPLAPTLAGAERIAARCAAARVPLAVNHTRRWAPDVRELAAELRDGDWGAVRAAAGTYTKGIVHNGGHMVDLLQLLLGPMRLRAAGTPRRDFWEEDPSVPALLETEAGVPVHLVPGHAGDYAVFELTLVTERGTVAMLDGGRRWSTRRAAPGNSFAGYSFLGQAEEVEGRYDEAMLAAVGNIADALERGSPLASSADNALAAQRLCDAIRAQSLLSSS